jgi:hypothetical protein
MTDAPYRSEREGVFDEFIDDGEPTVTPVRAPAPERNSRDLSQLHRVLDWLAKDEAGRTLTVDYHEGEVRVFFEQRKRRGETEDAAFEGKASDFAGAVDIAESEGWSDGRS